MTGCERRLFRSVEMLFVRLFRVAISRTCHFEERFRRVKAQACPNLVSHGEIGRFIHLGRHLVRTLLEVGVSEDRKVVLERSTGYH
jgi:hypothetical protein